jgi:endonuclease/exonuclease/phosphatase family metal-dependent hydrolase
MEYPRSARPDRCLSLAAAAILAGSAGCEMTHGEEARSLAFAATPVRIASANLSSGDRATYDEGHGARILAGIDADIVLINELNVGDESDAAVREFVDSTFGAGFSFFRETGGANLPNGVISRFPILESGVWQDSEAPDREFVFARLDVPGPRDLWAVSVHLLTTSTSRRLIEARELTENIQVTVPDQDLLVIGGDLNTGSMVESAWGELADVVVVDGPRPVDGAGNPNTNQPRSRPYDHVLPDSDLAPLRIPTRVGAQEFPTGLVVDTRIYQPLSDIAPALRNDSGANRMQHMAVLVDFELAGDDGPPPPPGEGELVLNEILANEPGSSTTGEFIELLNVGSETADLGGFTLSDATAVRHEFAAGDSLAPGASLVVTGGGSQPGDSRPASSGSLSLSNSGDTVTLRDAGGATVQIVSYTSALTARDGVSMTRETDGDDGAAFVLHDTVSALQRSPNRQNDGTDF